MACVLDPAVTVKQRMGILVGCQRSYQGIQHKCIVVTVAYLVGDNPTVAQVEENCRAMEFGPLTAAQMREIDRLLGRE